MAASINVLPFKWCVAGCGQAALFIPRYAPQAIRRSLPKHSKQLLCATSGTTFDSVKSSNSSAQDSSRAQASSPLKHTNMNAFSPTGFAHLLKDSFKGFSEDKVPKLGGSLAYFTIFSIGPMLLVVIFLAGIFLGKQAVTGSLHQQIEQLVGSGAAQQIQEIIKNASVSKGGLLAVVVGLVSLLLGATSVFAEIQDSINSI